MKDRFRLPFTELLRRWIADPPPDYLFEVTENSIACVSPRVPSAQRRETFGEAGITASPSTPNILKPDLYREAMPRISSLGLQAGATMALVIPDYAVRMAILDFEQFPAKPEDRTKLLQFRLRKSVPFPIDQAQLAHSVQSQETGQKGQKGRVEVLVVAIARPILEEYEGLFADAGFRLGLVQPSSIAALRLCCREDAGLTALVKAAGPTLSVILLDRGRVRMIRSLDLTGDETEWQRPSAGAVMPLLHQTFAYCEDQLGQKASRLLLCGFGPETDSLAELTELEFGVPTLAARSRFGIASQENAGLLGLLEEYAA